MPRSFVLSLYLDSALVNAVRGHVSAEGASAFWHRAIVREVVMQESVRHSGPLGCYTVHEYATYHHSTACAADPTADDVEAFARGWLHSLLHGASQDPRAEPDIAELMDWVDRTFRMNCLGDKPDQLGVCIPPVTVGDRPLIRKRRAPVVFGASHGATSLSLRWPWCTQGYLERLLPTNRSAFAAAAGARELSLVSHAEEEIVATDSTRAAFDLGSQAGVLYGTSLRPGGSLNPARVEDLVAREISAYLLEPVLGERPGRGRRRS